ncbi:MAG TPA: hypothetical protein VF541_15900 [Longimicrobium sp.]|jgi:hypothetical protein
MGDLKTTTQKPGGATTGMTPKGDEGQHNQGAEFGASDAATRGTDRDLDRSGTSMNQGHGHPREERGASHD